MIERLVHTSWGSHTLRKVRADGARSVRTGPEQAAERAGATPAGEQA